MRYKEYIGVTAIEELSEVQKAISKVLRFGSTSENINNLNLEINDMIGALELLMIEFELSDIDPNAIVEKINKINNWYNQ